MCTERYEDLPQFQFWSTMDCVPPFKCSSTESKMIGSTRIELYFLVILIQLAYRSHT